MTHLLFPTTKHLVYVMATLLHLRRLKKESQSRPSPVMREEILARNTVILFPRLIYLIQNWLIIVIYQLFQSQLIRMTFLMKRKEFTYLVWHMKKEIYGQAITIVKEGKLRKKVSWNFSMRMVL